MRVPPKAVGWTVAAAIAIGAPVTASWEGMRTEPYYDITNKLTVCLGETNVPMRPYTKEECLEMFMKHYGEYAEGALDCTPGLIGRPFQLAAATDVAYNAGIPAYCKSTARKRFNAGDYVGGCEATTWFVYANKSWIRGLFNRRKAGDAERASFYEICMTGLGGSMAVFSYIIDTAIIFSQLRENPVTSNRSIAA